MTKIILISINTVKEIKRHKLFYALTAAVFFMIGGGFLLGPLSLMEQVRLSINLSLTTCHIGLMMATLYFSSHLLSQEIERKTIVTLFVRPISRLQFIFGKFFGMLIIILIATVLLTGVMAVVHLIYGRSPVQGILFIAMWGMFLEALILVSVAFFFSSFSSSFFVFVCSFLIFVIGHAVNQAMFLASKGAVTGILKQMLPFIIKAFPDLEILNWRSHVLYQDSIPVKEWISASGYSLLWIVMLLILTGFLFERRTIA